MSRISVTLKMQGKDSPWIVLEHESVEGLTDLLTSVEKGDLVAQVGRCQGLVEQTQIDASAKFQVGKLLGARAEAPSKTVTAESENPWDGTPAPAPAPAPAAPVAKSPFGGGAVQAQASSPAPPPAPMANPFAGRPSAVPATASPFGSKAGSTEPVPGAPMILGQPAVARSGTGAKGRWTALVDPRPVAETDGLERTDDPEHPGLEAGTHAYWKFL